MHLVTISGLPGSGTSTLCRLLAERTGWQYLNTGQVFRELARESGVSLEEFGRRAEADAEIDRRLDERMIELARAAHAAAGCILEGRITGWMTLRHELPALRVWVHADIHTRASRVAHRDGLEVAQATKATLAREESERLRYASHHEIDLSDQSIYDLVIDSDHADPGQLAEAVIAGLRERGVLS